MPTPPSPSIPRKFFFFFCHPKSSFNLIKNGFCQNLCVLFFCIVTQIIVTWFFVFVQIKFV